MFTRNFIVALKSFIFIIIMTFCWLYVLCLFVHGDMVELKTKTAVTSIKATESCRGNIDYFNGKTVVHFLVSSNL